MRQGGAPKELEPLRTALYTLQSVLGSAGTLQTLPHPWLPPALRHQSGWGDEIGGQHAAERRSERLTCCRHPTGLQGCCRAPEQRPPARPAHHRARTAHMHAEVRPAAAGARLAAAAAAAVGTGFR